MTGWRKFARFGIDAEPDDVVGVLIGRENERASGVDGKVARVIAAG